MKSWFLGVGIVAGLVAHPSSAAAAAGPTFTKDVAPIVFDKCVSCHRPGEVAPMSLLTYEEVRPWAKAIEAKVKSGEMPPWGADPRYGKFSNDRTLTPAQIDTIVAWVKNGAPKGDDADMPKAPALVTGWIFGTDPDFVLEMPTEYHVPPEGELNMLNFYAPVPFKEDRFTRQLEWRPGNRAAIHHGVASVGTLPEGSKLDDQGQLFFADGTMENDFATQSTARRRTNFKFNLVVDYDPGRYAIPAHSDELGLRIPAGTYMRFNLHYQPTGKPETDRSRIGMWFNTRTDVQEVYRKQAGDALPTAVDSRKGFFTVQGVSETWDFNNGREETHWPLIPAFADNYSVMGVTPVTEAITVYGFTPHMHLRGKDMTWYVTYPDGRRETLLSVPNYHFNWQFYFDLAQPIKIPAGSTITNVAHYANTPNSKYNPAPDKDVYWSEQSWDEMYCPFIAYSIDSEAPKKGAQAKTSTQRQ